LPNNTFLNLWFSRPKANKEEVIPLKNSISPSTAQGTVLLTKWSNEAIGYCFSDGNDYQNAISTVVFSSPYFKGHGFYITTENLWQSAIVFSVRRLIKPTWLNDRDQFLQPTQALSEQFKNDCLIWMLFNGSNLSASANDLEWNNQKWSIVNHFIPFTEQEVNAPERFESDFMVQYLSDKKLSPEAKAVMNEGKKLWQTYFSQTDVRTVRDELKLNRSDVGWYQVRKALEARNKDAMGVAIDFSKFKSTYTTLGDKLRPQVYELGFLRQ
jgi:hypothetical protein